MNLRRQPQRLPPPIDFGSETLEGECILSEVPPQAAILMWKAVRAVRLWAALGPEDRTGAYSLGAFGQRMAAIRVARLDPDLSGPLKRVSLILKNAAVDSVEIADASRRISEWASERGFVGTALEFMQAAAFVLPGDAGLAREVAVLARRRAEYARSETWFRQAISRARRSREWPMFIRSYLGLGTVHILRGNYPAARKAFLRALRAAQRRASTELVAMAYHDLAGVAIRTSKVNEAGRYAHAALGAYGPRHPRLPALASDMAAFWMSRGYFTQALRVFETILPHLPQPVDRLGIFAGIVRSAAAADARERYESAWRESIRLLRNPATAPMGATALINMAHGALSMGDLERANEMAEQAKRLASGRGESEIVFEAESLLDSVGRTRSRQERAHEETKRPPLHVDRLTSEFAAAMPAGAGVP